MMRKSFQYSFIVMLMLISGLSAPNSFARDFMSKSKITGSWKFKDPNNGPQRLSFLKDGTYELDFDGDGNKDIWGLYRISQDWIILNDVGGDFVFDCSQQGAYSYHVADDALTFRIMADQCPSRSQAMGEQWLRVIDHAPKEPPIMMKI